MSSYNDDMKEKYPFLNDPNLVDVKFAIANTEYTADDLFKEINNVVEADKAGALTEFEG